MTDLSYPALLAEFPTREQRIQAIKTCIINNRNAAEYLDKVIPEQREAIEEYMKLNRLIAKRLFDLTGFRKVER